MRVIETSPFTENNFEETKEINETAKAKPRDPEKYRKRFA
jgi:hypothetical protein